MTTQVESCGPSPLHCPISCFLSVVLGLPVCEIISCRAGLIQVWILLLEQLTAAVSNCPRQHQPPTLELLFTLLREVTAVPGDTHSMVTCSVRSTPVT